MMDHIHCSLLSPHLVSTVCILHVIHIKSFVNSLHAEMVCSLLFINAEINVISLGSK